MNIAIFPGSFDPITNGHLDIIEKSSNIFDKVIVAVSYNSNKKSFLPIETRVDLIKKSIKNYNNVEIDSFEGLTVNYAKLKNSKILIRGLRNSIDFEYEQQLANINKNLNSNIETVFFLTKPEYSSISSSAIKEIYLNKGDISNFVPPSVLDFFKKSF